MAKEIYPLYIDRFKTHYFLLYYTCENPQSLITYLNFLDIKGSPLVSSISLNFELKRDDRDMLTAWILEYNLLKKGWFLPKFGSNDTSWINIKTKFSLRHRIIRGNNCELKNLSRAIFLLRISEYIEAAKRKWWDILSITINFALDGNKLVPMLLKKSDCSL